MSIKNIIRNKLSPKQMKCLKWAVMQYRYLKTRNRFGEYKVNQDYVDSFEVIGLPNKHVFFGYYDLQQLDESGQQALIHILDEDKCDPSVDSAEIAVYHIDEKKIEVLTETKAWSWQQGARLRWHPCKNNAIIFNDLEGDNYVAIEYDIALQCRKTIAPIPLYDVTKDMHYGLSLNFSRLQRLRPGYGYSVLNDDTVGVMAPKMDGIFRYDFIKKKVELLISLEKLAEQCPKMENVEHYVNHISISPSGKKFMFFHLWTSTQSSSWNMNLCVADIESGDFECIETEEIVSHYSWCGDNELLITTAALNGAQSKYIEYNLKDHSKRIIKGEWLNRDGHPTVMGSTDCFISDTYPINCEQFLFMEEHSKGTELVRVYSDPRMFDDMRCDLHPRLSNDWKMISFDSTFDRRVRQVVLLRMKDDAFVSIKKRDQILDEQHEYIIVGLGNQNNAIKEMFYEVIHGEIENASYLEPFRFNNHLLQMINRIVYSRKLRKYFKWMPQKIWEKYHVLSHIQLDKTKTSYIILTYGTDIERLHFSELIQKMRREYGTNVKFVLMLFDSVNSPLRNQGWDRVLDVSKEFDITATFDKKDAEDYGMLYFTDPYVRRDVDASEEYEHDLFFVGAEKGRGDYLKKIAEKLIQNHVDAEIRVVGLKSNQETEGLIKQDGYLKYDDMLKFVVSSNVILEVLCEGQMSASLRYYEAVVYNKKLLTNNPNIRTMPYFDERYMKYFETANDIDINWIKDKSPVDYHYKNDFSIKGFFDNLNELDNNERQ